MRRKQVELQMEHDPLTNFGVQLRGETEPIEEPKNKWGEKTIKIKPNLAELETQP